MFSDGPSTIAPAATWSDDEWFADQDERDIHPNEGHWVLADGECEGRLIGGNLCTLNLLQGTEFMPDLRGAIVFVEDDFLTFPEVFDRDLTSLTQQPGFEEVRGLLVGRFQPVSGVARDDLQAIVDSKRELAGMPIVANVDFGHTDPLMTIPVGGDASVVARGGTATITIG